MRLAALLFLFLLTGSVTFGRDDSVESEIDVLEDNENDLLKREQEEATMPNIGYLFRGYNILKGNPLSTGSIYDPGFQQFIFKPTYKTDAHTADRRYKVPDNVDVVLTESCSYGFSSETLMTMSDYKQSLMAKASVQGSAAVDLLEGSFSMSIEYDRVRQTVESSSMTIVKSEASCKVYDALVQSGTPPELSDNFIAYVKRLLKTRDYGRFLGAFGTHFVTEVQMGARYTSLQEISKSSKEKMQKDGIDIKGAASASALGQGSLESEKQIKVDRKSVEKFEKAVERTRVSTVGSKPPRDGDKFKWLSSKRENPLPLYYRLRSILDLFEQQYFNDIDVNFAAIRMELSNYLKGYCNTLKRTSFRDAECEGPPKGCRGGSQCSVNAKCTDTTSSYKCECKPGYKGNGKICDRDPKWTTTTVIEQESTRGPYGTWGGMEVCRDGVIARGFTFRFEEPQGRSDDTAGNSICLKCGYNDICSKQGNWGEWSEAQLCPQNSFLSGWRQNVEGEQGGGDDTSLDNVEYRCRDIETWERKKDMKVDATEWGIWSRWEECPEGEFICGIETRVEDPDGDDTALNDIKHQCCKSLFQGKKKSSLTRL